MVSKINFLLIEDNDLDAEKVERTFNQLDISSPVTRAKDGLEALEILTGKSDIKIATPIIILLDINMPRMNGLEFLAEIRKNPRLNNLPVFILTTSNATNDIDSAHQYNIQGYLVKPLKKDQMIEAFSILNAYWKLMEYPSSGSHEV